MRVVLQAFLLSRLWVAFFVYLGHWQRPYLEPVRGGWAGVDSWALNAWTAYDAGWYLRLAQHGYEPTSSVFFPLYPALLQPFSFSPVAAALWGVLLSNVFLVGGLWTLFQLARRDFDERVAARAVWLLAFFPTSVVFSSVYTESLFLLLVGALWLCLRARRWAWCAALGLMAGLTRNSGPILCAALLAEAWLAHRRGGAWKPVILCAVAPLLGFACVQTTLKARFEGLSTAEAQAFYGRDWTLPWLPLWHDVTDALAGQTSLVALLNMAAIVAVPVLLWRFRKQVPASYALMLGGVMLANLTLAHLTPPYTNSTLRYLSSLFPFALLLALSSGFVMRNRTRFVTSGALLLLCCAAFAWGWGQKQYVAG